MEKLLDATLYCFKYSSDVPFSIKLWKNTTHLPPAPMLTQH